MGGNGITGNELAMAFIPVGIGGKGFIGMELATAKLADTAKTVPNTTLENFNELEIIGLCSLCVNRFGTTRVTQLGE